MSDEQARALGERLAALRAHRRGMTIMLAVADPDDPECYPAGARGVLGNVSPDSGSAFVRWDSGPAADCDYIAAYLLPDARDPATKGAALEVARERWRYPVFVRQRESGNWEACVPASILGATEAEALVAALEAAPR